MKELLGTLYRFPAIFQQATANPRLQQQMNQKQLFPGRFNRFGALLACTSLGLAALVRGQTSDDFNPGADSYVFTMAIQPDGKILVGGVFTSLGGQARNRVGRLNSDGTLDPTFGPLAGEGAFPYVYSFGVQRDGKILVGGDFTKLGGQARDHLGRLNSNGTLDGSFNPGAGLTVWSLVEQPDGKFGGWGIHPGWRELGATASGGSMPMARWTKASTPWRPQPTGRMFTPWRSSRTAGLSPAVPSQSWAARPSTGLAGSTLTGRSTPLSIRAPTTRCFAWRCRADGKILVGGSFTNLKGQPRVGIGRLNGEGTLDTGFNPVAGGTFPNVYTLAVQADGKILVGGEFTTLGGQTRNYLARLNSDGTLDPAFNPGASNMVNGVVFCVAVQADGKVLAGGNFGTLGGQRRARIGRLNNTDPATQSLLLDATSITWLRGGASPEVGRASFDFSTNRGNSWIDVGVGTRISGGWQVSSPAVPASASIRARGFVAGGRYNGSGWFVESLIDLPLVVSQPLSRTNNGGTAATFSVLADGTPPLGFQWRRDGVSLGNGGNLPGAQTLNLDA